MWGPGPGIFCWAEDVVRSVTAEDELTMENSAFFFFMAMGDEVKFIRI